MSTHLRQIFGVQNQILNFDKFHSHLPFGRDIVSRLGKQGPHLLGSLGYITDSNKGFLLIFKLNFSNFRKNITFYYRLPGALSIRFLRNFRKLTAKNKLRNPLDTVFRWFIIFLILLIIRGRTP